MYSGSQYFSCSVLSIVQLPLNYTESESHPCESHRRQNIKKRHTQLRALEQRKLHIWISSGARVLALQNPVRLPPSLFPNPHLPTSPSGCSFSRYTSQGSGRSLACSRVPPSSKSDALRGRLADGHLDSRHYSAGRRPRSRPKEAVDAVLALQFGFPRLLRRWVVPTSLQR